MNAFALPVAGLPASNAVPRPVIGARNPASAETSPLHVTTLVLWLGCLTVGALGLAWTYPRPVAPAKAAPPVVAQVLHVELTNDPLPPPDIAPAGSAPPPLLEPLPAAAAPALVAVAEPLPSVAFALPVEGPTRIVDVQQAASGPQSAPANPVPAATAAPAVEALAYGQGEGRQPAPTYPPRARNAGQEGTVVVRFSVGEDGRVLAAESPAPSPWPLLNESALRVVRERWRFRPGPVRRFEVAIRFELGK